MCEKLSMRRLFAILICANGVLTVLLSCAILANIWIDNFITDHVTTGKIVVSYLILLVNFVIFVTMYTKLQDSDRGSSPK